MSTHFKTRARFRRMNQIRDRCRKARELHRRVWET